MIKLLKRSFWLLCGEQSLRKPNWKQENQSIFMVVPAVGAVYEQMVVAERVNGSDRIRNAFEDSLKSTR